MEKHFLPPGQIPVAGAIAARGRCELFVNLIALPLKDLRLKDGESVGLCPGLTLAGGTPCA